MPIPDHVSKPNAPRRKSLFPSLRSKLTAYFSVLFAVVIILIEIVDINGIPFTNYKGTAGHGREEAFRSLNLIADLKKDRLLRWIKDLHNDIHVFAENDTLKRRTDSLLSTIEGMRSRPGEGEHPWNSVKTTASFRGLSDYLNFIVSTYEVYEAAHIIEPKTGRIIVSTDERRLGEDVSDHSFFDIPMRTGIEHIVSDIEAEPYSMSPVLHTSDFIFDERGEILALLVVQVDVNDIIRPMLHTGEGLGEKGEALLINQDVRILTSLKHPLADGTRAKPLEYQITAKPAVLAARGEEGIIEIEDYRGESVLAAYRHIRVNPERGWGMVVKRDREELLQPILQEITYAFLTGLIGVLAVVGLTVLASRTLTHPLFVLSETARDVGEGNLEARAPVTTDDEVGELAATFNSMLDSIQQRTTELAAVNKELEAFSYSVSHDLRAPLRSMDGFSQLLLEDYLEALDEEGQDYLERIRAASQRMGKLIDDLLSLSRVTRSEMRREQVNLSRIAQAVTADLCQADPDRNVNIKITPGMVTTGDSHLLGIVIDNLLNNAWKFTQNCLTATVEVGYTNVDGRTAYFVRDNGAGFDMAYANKLFGAFQRLHTMSEFPGTGIGLATVQRIIHRHGGKIWAEGEPDKGATFYFTL